MESGRGNERGMSFRRRANKYEGKLGVSSRDGLGKCKKDERLLKILKMRVMVKV